MMKGFFRGSRHTAFPPWLVSLLTLSLLGTASAQAAPLYSAISQASLIIDDIVNQNGGSLTDLSVQGGGSVDTLDQVNEGSGSGFADAVASPMDLTDLGIGQSIDLLALIDGTTGGDAQGSSSADIATSGNLLLGNLSATDTFSLSFTLNYQLGVTTALDDAFGQMVAAMAQVSLFSTQAIDALLDETLALTATDPADDLYQSDFLSFDITLAPGDFENLFFTADASGRVTQVPLPTSLGLFALGLLIWRSRLEH